jgi:signal transduction histidine kinase
MMNAEKLSIQKILVMTGTGVAITAAAMLAALYLLTGSVNTVLCGFIFVVIIIIWTTAFIYLVRKKLSAFSSGICHTIDSMMSGKMDLRQSFDEETLFAKINYRLTRLYETMQEHNRSVAKEKADLQEVISDTSHQVKMPIANLKMINATLLEETVPEEKQREFLLAMDGQLDKLDFLMQAMIKMSRLETGFIALEKKDGTIYETLAAALGGILLPAENKGIHVDVSCPEELTLSHDRKWTAEALFNILDNAVKYTPAGGSIKITVEPWELYLKIDITDTGKGIPENRHAEIFKRFYREAEVHSIDGIGIGLYLAREIITMQGGYIKVVSEAEKGATFSVFLPYR